MRLNGTVFSSSLQMDTPLTVLTPNSPKNGGAYKAVYLLHGICGNSRTWLDYSMLADYASGSDTVYIMPDAARSFYTDMEYGLPYFTYITKELPEICRNLFNISPKREDTAIMGASMGGYGALKCALTYPEYYGMCAAFSSCCLFLKEGLQLLREQRETNSVTDERILHDLEAAFGDGLTWREDNDIIFLLNKVSAQNKMPKLYLSCGTSDPFFNDHRRLAEILDKSGIGYKMDTWDAYHNFEYFNEALKKAIKYFGL